MRSYATTAILLLCVMGLSSCATPVVEPPPAKVPLEVPPPRLAPPPADLMVAEEPNYRTRLLLFFSGKLTAPTD